MYEAPSISSDNTGNENELTCGPLRLRLRDRTLYRKGYGVKLGPRECRVLELLMRAKGTPVSMSELLALAWGDPVDDQAVSRVRGVVQRLRGKLGSDRYIETIGGEGYRFNLGA